MPEEENKSIIERLFTAFNQGGAAEIADELLSADYIQHSTLVPPGREGFMQFFAAFSQAFPDASFAIEDIIAENDKVVIRYTARMTHLGEFMRLLPTGKEYQVSGIDIFRISNGKISEHWEEIDRLGLLQQFGIVPGWNRLRVKALLNQLKVKIHAAK